MFAKWKAREALDRARRHDWLTIVPIVLAQLFASVTTGMVVGDRRGVAYIDLEVWAIVYPIVAAVLLVWLLVVVVYVLVRERLGDHAPHGTRLENSNGALVVTLLLFFVHVFFASYTAIEHWLEFERNTIDPFVLDYFEFAHLGILDSMVVTLPFFVIFSSLTVARRFAGGSSESLERIARRTKSK